MRHLIVKCDQFDSKDNETSGIGAVRAVQSCAPVYNGRQVSTCKQIYETGGASEVQCKVMKC